MSDFEAQVQLDLEGNLAGEAKRAERAIKALSTNAGRDFKRLRTASVSLSNGINKLGGRYTGLISSAGLALAARRVASHAERLTYLGIQANRSQEEIEKFNKKLYETAQAADVRINPDQLLTAVEKIVEKTGDLDFAKDNLRNMALAIRGAKADGQGLGGLTAELQKLGDFKSPDAVLTALDTLTVQGKQGAFTLENMAQQGERLFAAYGATGRGGKGLVGEIGTLAQVARMGTGSAEMATTAFEALLRSLNDGAKQKMLTGAGIELFDPEKLAQGVKVLRPVPELLKEIITVANADQTMLGQIFDAEAMRGINSAIRDFQQNNNFENTFDKFSNMSSDGGQLFTDAARAAKTANAAVQSLTTTWDEFSQKKLDGPLKSLADLSTGMKPEQLEGYLNAGLYGAMGLGGLWMANKVGRAGYSGYKGIQSLRGKGAGGKGRSLAGGLVTAAAASAQPVFVTNWPLNGMGGGGTGGDTFVEGGDKKKRPKINRSRGPRGLVTGGGKFGLVTRAANALTNLASKSNLSSKGGLFSKTTGLITSGARNAARNAGRFVKSSAPIALTLGAVNMGSALMDGDTRGALGAGGSIAGGLAGMQVGATAGAIAGSVVPVIGTAIGGFLGGLVGGGLGAYFGGEGITALYDQFTGSDDKKVQIDTQPLDDGLRGMTKALEDNTRAQEKRSPNPRRFGGNEYGGLQGGAL